MGRNPGTPHYLRILADLQHELDQDEAGTGRQVQSERALARRYGVARHTARRALEELRSRGRIVRLQGAGSFSADAAAGRVISLGYLLEQEQFARMFSWLSHRLQAAGYAVERHDLGLHGEYADAIQLDDLATADAVVWLAPSHPDGLARCLALRRKLPSHLPLVLINDSLGTSNTGRRRVDFVQFDVPSSARRVAEYLLQDGVRHPVLLRRRDVTVGYLERVSEAFIATLVGHGLADAASHVQIVDIDRPQELAALWQPHDGRPWAPDAILLCWDWAGDLRRQTAAGGWTIPDDCPVVLLQDGDEVFRTRQDFRAMGEICADLVLSRLRLPTRPNLSVNVNLPVVPLA